MDHDEVARLLRAAEAFTGGVDKVSPLVSGLATQLRLAVRPAPSLDEVERTDMQRLLELHRDQLTMWQSLARELAHRFDAASRAAKGWLEGNAAHIKTLEVVTVASTKLVDAIAKLQTVADKAYGAASPELLDRMFYAECTRIAARIPEDVWQAMVGRRAGR